MANLVFTLTVLDGDFPASLSKTAFNAQTNTLEISDEGASITAMVVKTQPTVGHMRVTDGFDLIYQTTGDLTTGSFDAVITVTEAGKTPVDCTVTVTVSEPSNITVRPEEGWPPGEYYLLGKSAVDDRMEIEPTPNFKAIYVQNYVDETDTPEVWTRAKIQAVEGSSSPSYSGDEFGTSDVLATQPYATPYGFADTHPVDPDCARWLWRGRVEVSGDWGPASAGVENTALLFKRGETFSSIVYNYGGGPSPLHPLLIGAWGTGAKPKVNHPKLSNLDIYKNIVYQDIEPNNFTDNTKGDNIMFDHLRVTHELKFNNAQNGRVSLRNSHLKDIVIGTADEYPPGIWDANSNRASGFYAAGVHGLLIENNFFDHCGWADGYDRFLDTTYPQPPSQFSHNIYVAANNLDVGLKKNILMRPASTGAQMRSSGFFADNFFVDCGVVSNASGGIVSGGTPGTDTMLANGAFVVDNVTTGNGYKFDRLAREGVVTPADNYVVNDPIDGDVVVNGSGGAVNWGFRNDSLGTVARGNLFCHFYDPNNSFWDSYTFYADPGFLQGAETPITVDDSVVFNYSAEQTDVAKDLITTPLYADDLLSETPGTSTTDDLANYFDTVADFDGTYAVAACDWFRAGFSISRPTPGSLGVQTFSPYLLADATRFDNRLNWDNGFEPRDGDSIDLDGYMMRFCENKSFVNLNLGSGGRLKVTGGKMTVTGDLTTSGDLGCVDVSFCGQFFVNGYADTDLVTFNVTGGRFANTGALGGAWDMNISGSNTEVILAQAGDSATLASGRTMTLTGSPLVGFDGTGGGAASITFAAGSTLIIDGNDAAKPSIREFRSGMNGETATSVASTVTCGGTLDLTDAASGTYNLFDVDTVSGTFATVIGGTVNSYASGKVNVTKT